MKNSQQGFIIPIIITIVAILAIGGAVYFASHEKAEAPTVEIKEVPDKPAENPSFDSGTYPVISSISPATGPVGTVVSLAVSNFTNDAAVYVGVSDSSQKAWNPLSVSTTTITFVIPKDLSVGVHDINIMISTKHTPTSNRVKFTVTPPVNSNLPVACTMDAMMCPDGSYVGRSGPKCEFVCPIKIIDQELIFTGYLILGNIGTFSFLNQRLGSEMDYFGGVSNGIENYEARYSSSNSQKAFASVYKFDNQNDSSDFIEETKAGWDKTDRAYTSSTINGVKVYKLSRSGYNYSFWVNGDLVIAIVEPNNSSVIFNEYFKHYK
jgi:hypothetical protein